MVCQIVEFGALPQPRPPSALPASKINGTLDVRLESARLDASQKPNGCHKVFLDAVWRVLDIACFEPEQCMSTSCSDRVFPSQHTRPWEPKANHLGLRTPVAGLNIQPAAIYSTIGMHELALPACK